MQLFPFSEVNWAWIGRSDTNRIGLQTNMKSSQKVIMPNIAEAFLEKVWGRESNLGWFIVHEILPFM